MDQDIVLKIVRNFVLMAVVASMLAACGGGSGSSIAPQPQQQNNSAVLSTQTLKGAPGFVNPKGFTVYVFDGDLADPGHSTCNAGNGCSQDWPHVPPPAGKILSGQFSTITRDDGSTQLTYAGRPLYTFAFDSQPGQTNGDGLDEFGGVWHVARPQSTSSPSPSPTSSSSPSPMPTHTGY
jgi:predicted lipoprotein with Yx(FWY)xxD motif